jgi:hypothetical protein
MGASGGNVTLMEGVTNYVKATWVRQDLRRLTSRDVSGGIGVNAKCSDEK